MGRNKAPDELRQHKVDFVRVLPAFSDPGLKVVVDDRRDYGEVRFNMLGQVGDKLDRDVVEWFKAQGGRGYQTRINAVLRKYMEANRKAS